MDHTEPGRLYSAGKGMAFRFTFITALLLLSAVCRGDVTIQIDPGWDGVYRPGRWVPVFLTLASDRPRQVDLELYVPHDSTFAMSVHESVAVDTKPVTIRLYAPLPQMLDEFTVIARDARTRRTVGE